MASSEPMFSFRLSSAVSKSGPRLGTLKVGSQTLETPAFFAPTIRGVVPHLTPDVLKAHTDVPGAYVALEDFLEKAPQAPLLTTPLRLKEFTSMPRRFVSVLGARRVPSVTTPGANSDRELQIITSVGFRSLLWDDFTKAVIKLQPDMVVGVADIPNKEPGKTRKPKMANRTELWINSLLERLTQAESKTAVFAPVLPLEVHEQQLYINTLEEKRNSISGLAVYRAETLADLPDWTTELPKYTLDIPAVPHEILRQIELGVDIFNLNMVTDATNNGFALTFDFSAETAPETPEERPLALDLWPKEHATDLKPLVEGCTCYACTKHHRAFIQHMLGAKEMTAWVLLQIHNFHTLTNFFTDIRTALTSNTFSARKSAFERTYARTFPEPTGQGPRVRGYEFKTEKGGAAKGRRNKPAFVPLGRGADESEGIEKEVRAEELEAIGFAERTDRI